MPPKGWFDSGMTPEQEAFYDNLNKQLDGKPKVEQDATILGLAIDRALENAQQQQTATDNAATESTAPPAVRPSTR